MCSARHFEHRCGVDDLRQAFAKAVVRGEKRRQAETGRPIDASVRLEVARAFWTTPQHLLADGRHLSPEAFWLRNAVLAALLRPQPYAVQRAFMLNSTSFTGTGEELFEVSLLLA